VDDPGANDTSSSSQKSPQTGKNTTEKVRKNDNKKRS